MARRVKRMRHDLYRVGDMVSFDPGLVDPQVDCRGPFRVVGIERATASYATHTQLLHLDPRPRSSTDSPWGGSWFLPIQRAEETERCS